MRRSTALQNADNGEECETNTSQSRQYTRRDEIVPVDGTHLEQERRQE